MGSFLYILSKVLKGGTKLLENHNKRKRHLCRGCIELEFRGGSWRNLGGAERRIRSLERSLTQKEIVTLNLIGIIPQLNPIQEKWQAMDEIADADDMGVGETNENDDMAAPF